MTHGLMTKLSELTGGKYDYLVLRSVDVEISRETVRVEFIYPEPKESEVRAAKDEIIAAAVEALGSKATVEVKLTKSHFDADFFKAGLLSFFEAYPSVAPYVFADNIKITRRGEYAFDVRLELDDDVCEFALSRGVDEGVRKYIASSQCEDVSFELVPVAPKERTDHIELAEEALRNYVYQTAGAHYIVPENVEELVGKIIYDRAGYISDATHEAEGVTYCGTVSGFEECTRRPREGEEETEPRKFYKFTLTDPTGSLKCLYFPRKRKNGSADMSILELRDGKQAVVKGSLKENRFRGQVSYDMFVRSISLCTLPENIEIARDEYRPPEEYRTVEPGRYREVTQTTMFDRPARTASYLMGKTFCVFDVETTGIDTATCKIIEIGAVRIEDGKLTETFSTYIDPHEHIPERITSLTSITDADVAGAPDIQEAIGDFYKFSKGSILVGQNVNFDLGFVNAAGKAMGITFDNPREDTLELARENVKGLRNYKLGTILKYFGLYNEHAHRAIHDAVATAKAFIRIVELREQGEQAKKE